jgi:hypothetical protein
MQAELAVKGGCPAYLLSDLDPSRQLASAEVRYAGGTYSRRRLHRPPFFAPAPPARELLTFGLQRRPGVVRRPASSAPRWSTPRVRPRSTQREALVARHMPSPPPPEGNHGYAPGDPGIHRRWLWQSGAGPASCKAGTAAGGRTRAACPPTWRPSSGSRSPCFARSRSGAIRARAPAYPRCAAGHWPRRDRPASPPLVSSWCGQGYLGLGHAGPAAPSRDGDNALDLSLLATWTNSVRVVCLGWSGRSHVLPPPLDCPPPQPGHGERCPAGMLAARVCGSSTGDVAARKLRRPASRINMPAQRARRPGRWSRAGPDGGSNGTNGHSPACSSSRGSRAARQERQFQVCSAYN